ncbi:MAG: alpha/beta fold hydrolase [Acidimicrobiales bacterium]
MPFATVNGVRLRYEREGRGARVVLVHGSWGDHESWRAVGPLLARDLEVVTYDRRGHSASEAPPGQGSIVDDVDDVAGLIAHLGPERAHLVGTSAGATIVLLAAVAYPHLLLTASANEPDQFQLIGAGAPPDALADLEALTAENVPVLELIETGDHDEAARRFMETVTFGPGAWDRLPDSARRRYTVNAPTYLDQRRDPGWRSLDVGRLDASPVPLQLLCGDQTRPAFQAVVHALAGQVRRARVSVLEGCGHASAATHPESFASALRAFWQEVGGSAAVPPG